MNMQSFQFASQINQEGLLSVKLPPDFANQMVDIILVVNPKPKQVLAKRPIGQYAGKMHMSEDFSEPLPDEFWLGEDQ